MITPVGHLSHARLSILYCHRGSGGGRGGVATSSVNSTCALSGSHSHVAAALRWG
jgi:hypothetical protein